MKPKPPALTPPPQVPLHNKYNHLTPNRMCDDECNAKMNKNKRNGPKTQPRAIQNIRRSPNATTKVRTTEAIDTTKNGIDTILIGDSVTQYLRMAKTENITFSDTSVRELIDILPTCSAHARDFFPRSSTGSRRRRYYCCCRRRQKFDSSAAI